MTENTRRSCRVQTTACLSAVMLCMGSMGLGCSPSAGSQGLKGRIKIDGSSTVAPITMAAAEMFQGEQPRVRVTVGVSGTGGGFKKFLDSKPALRTDITDASRPIKPSEMSQAEALGIEYIEIAIAIDGLAIVINPTNGFCDYLTVDELKRIWEPGSAINNWSQIRDGFPSLPLKLYGPGTDSGTFDYFTQAIVGQEGASRADYTASESDNVLVQGVAGDRGALGYFGYSYYESNRERLKVVAIDNNDGKPVKPSPDVVRSGAYKPLSRPLFLYVNKEAYARPEVRAFLSFLFDNAEKIVEHPRVNYVALPDRMYAAARQRLNDGVTGSAMARSHGEQDLGAIFGVR